MKKLKDEKCHDCEHCKQSWSETKEEGIVFMMFDCLYCDMTDGCDFVEKKEVAE